MKYNKDSVYMIDCKHNDAVTCDRGWMCARCGWNPKVEERRRKKVRDKYGKPTEMKWGFVYE